MTEQLRDLLHDRAAGADFPTPDLDTLVRAGDRRVRRRRTALGAGSLAALAVAAALVVPGVTGDDGAGPDVTDGRGDALPVGVVSWVDGSVLHAGDATQDLGTTVRAFVPTSVGYVAADADGRVLSVVDGEAVEVGSVDPEGPRLVADHGSSLVGWVDRSGERPRFVVYDQATDTVVLDDSTGTRPGMSNLADDTDPAYFYALDGDTAYWRDRRGAVAVSVGTGEVRVVDAEARTGFDLVDVQDGVLALYGEQGVEIGTSPATARPLVGVQQGNGLLAPLATAYAPDADTARVVGTNGTELQLLVPPEYFFSSVYEWADDQTVRVVALESPDASADLLSCVVATGACELVADAVGREGDLQLPVGENLGG